MHTHMCVCTWQGKGRRVKVCNDANSDTQHLRCEILKNDYGYGDDIDDTDDIDDGGGGGGGGGDDDDDDDDDG